MAIRVIDESFWKWAGRMSIDPGDTKTLDGRAGPAKALCWEVVRLRSAEHRAFGWRRRREATAEHRNGGTVLAAAEGEAQWRGWLARSRKMEIGN